LAGGYPAFFLSGFKIQKMLRGQLSFGSSKSYARNALVITQFTASTVLIISSLFIYRQLNYMQNKKLGYNKEQVVTVQNIYALGDNIATFRQEMLRQPAVEAVTVSSSIPTPSTRNTWSFLKTPELRGDNGLNLQRWATDPDFLNTLNIELVAGRFFDENLTTDSTAIVINESAARAIGLADPIGTKIYTSETREVESERDFTGHTIIGVVKDFHWSSLRNKIEGLVMVLEPSNNLISFRYQGDKSAEVLAALESNWTKLAPDAPFSYEFMDDAYSQVYQAEQRISIIALLFTALAIFISCLGLLGLVAYMAEQRTREIGIRKVLGASVTNIIQLLSSDFIKLVVVALLIAVPISYYFMNNWLADFAYRIDLSGWTFAAAGVLTLFVALLTVGAQALQAALINPVDAIQND
ncbi:MAG: ABC transporter permease, partial [Saprospiraceae bacterium]